MKKTFTFIMCLLLINIAVKAQGDYKVIRAKLPMSSFAKDYYVKQIGTNYVLNGDIIVGSTLQRLAIYQSNNTDGAYIWPKGYVPVKIDAGMDNKITTAGASMSANALEAIKVLDRSTNIRFVRHTTEKDYIRIMYTDDLGYGGISPVGRQGGEQKLYITRESDIKTIIHELLHSLGFWHEQSRYDRDNFVVIDTNNVEKKNRYNFQIEPGTPTSAYDYNSIMHYWEKAFAIDKTKPTIFCKNGNVVSNCSLGNSPSYFSDLDIAGINSSYWYNKDLGRINYVTNLPNDPFIQKGTRIIPGIVNNNAAATKVADKPLAAGIYNIRVKETGKYLDVTDARTGNGIILQQWDKTNGDNQKFAVSPIGNGLYLFKAMHSNRYLNVIGQSMENRAGICQWDYVEQDNLKFYIVYKASAKGYVIRGLQSNMSWIVTSKENGSPVLQDQNFGDALIFEWVGNIPSVIKAEDKMKKTGSFNNSGIIRKQ